MARHLTRAQVRAVDRYAIEELGIPSVVLMENAGRNAAERIDRWLREHWLPARGDASSSPGRVAIVSGNGNNGGDGFVIARHLTQRGHDVRIDLAAEPPALTPDAATNHAVARNMNIPIEPLPDEATLAAML